MYLYPPLANLNIEYSLSRSLLSIYSSVYRYRLYVRTVSNKKKVCCLIYFFTFLIFPILFLFLGGLSSEFQSNLHKSSTSHQKRTAHSSGWCVQHHRTYSLVTFSFLFPFVLWDILLSEEREKKRKWIKSQLFCHSALRLLFFFRRNKKDCAD
jgi:hypothetical protein